MEVKEEVDTDDEALITASMHADDLAKLDQMEKEYNAYLAKETTTMPVFMRDIGRVYTVGARLSKFARSNAQRRTASVETRRKD